MKQKHLIGLGIAALVAMGAAVYLSEARKPAEQAPVAGPLAPGLEARINEVNEVAIRAAGGETITLVRAGDGWGVRERDGYPADVGRLRELLLNLAQAQRIEPKTAIEASYPRLGVQDPDSEGARNVLLSVAGIEPKLAVIIGDNNSRGPGTYVRLQGETQSWLIDRNLAADQTVTGWLQRDLFDIAPNRITAIEIRPASGESVRIEVNSGGEGEFRVANLPRGREQASAFVADSTAGLLAGLRFDDVRSAEGYAAADGAETTTARFDTRDGLRLELAAHTRDGETWVRFDWSLDEAVASERIEGEQAREAMAHEQAVEAAKAEAGEGRAAAESSEDALAEAGSADTAATSQASSSAASALPEAPLAVRDPEAFKAERLKSIRDEHARLQKATEGWVFKLPSFKADTLRRGMDAYLKPKA